MKYYNINIYNISAAYVEMSQTMIGHKLCQEEGRGWVGVLGWGVGGGGGRGRGGGN